MEGVEAKQLEKLFETKGVCPACGSKEFQIVDYLYDLPYVGKVVLTVGQCSVCGYKFNDVRVLEAGRPRKLVFKIEEPKDLNVLVVRTSTASIIIPEMGLEMRPGAASQGFITTVEGVLERFLEALEIACKDPSADPKACSSKEREIKDAMNGLRKFTLILEDPEGTSKIVSDKVKEEPL